MTGSGSIQASPRIRHGFTLHCDPSDGPIRLEVDWDDNYFRLEELESALCLDHSVFEPESPIAPFDTYVAAGTGRLNGQLGASISWVMTDVGQPPWGDYAEFDIYDPAGNLVLSAAGYLQYGNHQALSDRAGLAGWLVSLGIAIWNALNPLQP